MKNELIIKENPIIAYMQNDGNFLREALTAFVNELMVAEAQNLTGADYYQRSENRTNYFNGSRKRPLKTGLGTLDLAVPKLRKGTYFPAFLEARTLSDEALQNVICSAYVNGVSTRKIDKVVENLGVHIDKNEVTRITTKLSETVQTWKNRPITEEYPIIYADATFPKIRENGTVTSQALMIALGVKKDGTREILGCEISQNENGEGWKNFFFSLTERGLKGVKLVISDAHNGLKEAIFSTFTGASWQRCVVHWNATF
jgi:transposase-like protein